MEVERSILPNLSSEDNLGTTAWLEKGRIMGSVQVIDVEEEPALTLADIDADTGKYHDPTDDAQTGEGHFHATGEEFLECLRSGYCLHGDG